MSDAKTHLRRYSRVRELEAEVGRLKAEHQHCAEWIAAHKRDAVESNEFAAGNLARALEAEAELRALREAAESNCETWQHSEGCSHHVDGPGSACDCGLWDFRRALRGGASGETGGRRETLEEHDKRCSFCRGLGGPPRG